MPYQSTSFLLLCSCIVFIYAVYLTRCIIYNRYRIINCSFKFTHFLFDKRHKTDKSNVASSAFNSISFTCCRFSTFFVIILLNIFRYIAGLSLQVYS